MKLTKTELKRKEKAIKKERPFPVTRRVWQTVDICPFCDIEIVRSYTKYDYLCLCSNWKLGWIDSKWKRVPKEVK